MATERVLSNLNLISFKTEGGLQNHIDELQDGDLAFTPDNSLKGILLDFKWADHLLDDMSWLRADTFSWQSGDVYVAAYNHLASEMHIENLYAWQEEESRNVYTKSATPSVGDSVYRTGGGLYGTVQSVGADNITVNGMNFPRNSGGDILGTNAETDTVDDITITYYRAEDGHKICLPDQEDKVLALYNATGVAWYYILDTANKQFKLPRSKHNKYVDTAPVVGNGNAIQVLPTNNLSNTNTNVLNNEPSSQYGLFVSTNGGSIGGGFRGDIALHTDPEKSGIIAQQAQDTDQYKYLYFYVGNFEKEAIEQTAGVTTETLNSKADSDLGNIPANYDYVIESQMPTEANGYTWYRKYKSGWVEQGGFAESSSGDYDVVLPIEMSDTMYCVTAMNSNQSDKDAYGWIFNKNKITTGFTLGSRHSGGTRNYLYANWQVSGMAAQ